MVIVVTNKRLLIINVFQPNSNFLWANLLHKKQTKIMARTCLEVYQVHQRILKKNTKKKNKINHRTMK